MSRSAHIPDFRFAAFCVAGAAMPWSKAGLSIGMGLLLIASLLHGRAVGTFRGPIGWSSLALLAALLVSALISTDLSRGWSEWTSFWPILFLFLGAAAVRDAAHPERFLIAVLASTTVATLPSLQHLASELAASGELVAKLDPPTNIWLYTLAMATGATIATRFAMHAASVPLRFILIAVTILHLAAMVATQRRALILLTLVILAGLLCLSKRNERPLRLWLGMGGALAALLTLAFALDARVRELAQPAKLFTGDSSRALMWEFALDRYREHPVFGMGIGDLRDALHAHADEVELRIRIENRSRETEDRVIVNLHHSHCHSNFLHTMAVAGTAGLLGIIGWLFCLPLVLARGWRHDREAVLLGLAAWTLLFFGGITDASMYSSSRLAAFTLIFGFAWGLLLRSTPTAPAAVSPSRNHDAAVD